jgi:hypothetical protein
MDQSYLEDSHALGALVIAHGAIIGHQFSRDWFTPARFIYHVEVTRIYHEAEQESITTPPQTYPHFQCLYSTPKTCNSFPLNASNMRVKLMLQTPSSLQMARL